MAKLRIMTWYWPQPGGRTKYVPGHVNLWADGIDRNCTLDYELACVTAHPEGIDERVKIIAPPGDFEDVRIPTWGPKFPQCLRRLAMFRPDAADIFGERFVSMDLDAVIGANIDSLFDHDDDFRMYRGTSARRPYNGSMVQMTAGCRSRVYTEFTAQKAVDAGKHFIGSDQAWISYALGWVEKTWGPEHGVVWHGSRLNPPPEDWRIMFFPGTPKPWEVKGDTPTARWIDEHYRREMLEAA